MLARLGVRLRARLVVRSGVRVRVLALMLGVALSPISWAAPVRESGSPQSALVMAHCFEIASRRYGMSSLLLKAIAQQESAMNPRAINRNANGSTDVGLMQINSSWFPLLARYGVRPADLWEPCTNIMVGAWILGDNMVRMGPTVAALGAYNARDPVKRERYARQVLQHLTRMEQRPLPVSLPNVPPQGPPQAPTHTPTRAPTKSPTESPTKPPTPIKAPTKAPTKPPPKPPPKPLPKAPLQAQPLSPSHP